MEKLISEIVFETQKCRIKLFPKFHERSLVLRELISYENTLQYSRDDLSANDVVFKYTFTL